jgi:hypothetical protein
MYHIMRACLNIRKNTTELDGLYLNKLSAVCGQINQSFDLAVGSVVRHLSHVTPGFLAVVYGDSLVCDTVADDSDAWFEWRKLSGYFSQLKTVN